MSVCFLAPSYYILINRNIPTGKMGNFFKKSCFSVKLTVLGRKWTGIECLQSPFLTPGYYNGHGLLLDYTITKIMREMGNVKVFFSCNRGTSNKAQGTRERNFK
jgi:hypothetical protein